MGFLLGLFTRSRLTSLLKPRLHDTTCCEIGCQTGLTTGWTTGCIVYTNIQPVVNTAVQPRCDNRLYRVNGLYVN